MAILTKDIRTAIRTADTRFEYIFGKSDAAGIAELYTEKAMLLPTGSDFIQGQKAIQEFWQGAIDAGIKEVKLDMVEAELHGDTVIEMGRFILNGGDGRLMDQGKYMVIWKHENGDWKLHRDIWNTSMPRQ